METSIDYLTKKIEFETSNNSDILVKSILVIQFNLVFLALLLADNGGELCLFSFVALCLNRDSQLCAVIV